MRTGLFVMTHKEIKNVFPENRKIMLVGACDKKLPKDYYSDCMDSDNISNKNYSFCELTGLYAMMKTDFDILGLEHYRRVFVKRKLYFFRYPFLKEKDVQKLLTKFDIILPKKGTVEGNVYDQYAKDHIKDDIDKTIKIVKQKYPDYVDALNEVMKSNQLYFCNMFIGKSEIIKEYAKWLFDILFTLEQQIDISDRDTYQKRVFGFLSERLFNVWLKKHQEVKIAERRVKKLSNKDFEKENKQNMPFVVRKKKIKLTIA